MTSGSKTVGLPTRGRTPSSQLAGVIVSAAAELISAGEPMTVRAVAERANTAPMSVYNRFGDKQGLLDAVVQRQFAQLGEALDTLEEVDPLRRLRDAGNAFRDLALASPRLYRLLWESPPGDAGMAAFRSLVNVVRYGQFAGVIIAEDPMVLAGNIWACVRGGVAVELGLDPDRAAQAGGVSAQVDYQLLLDMIIRGISGSRPIEGFPRM